MADTKISGATADTAPVATDELPLNSGGASKKITLANLTKAMPGYEIGYDEITSSVSVTATTEASGTTVISCAAHTFDGSPVLLTFYAPFINVGATGGSYTVVNLFEGATQIGRLTTALNNGAAVQDMPCVAHYRFTPSAGSHTYTITALRGGSNGTIGAGAGGTATDLPAFARFTKV